MITKEQLISGLIEYADAEVLPILPTSGKWIVGTGITLASRKADSIVNALMSNGIVKAFGIVNDDGLIDENLLLDALKETADRYGNMRVDIPVVGKLTFSPADVEKLKSFVRA